MENNSAETTSDLGIILTMIHVAWADQSLSLAELDLVREEIADQGLSELEQRVVEAALMNPPGPAEIVQYFSSPDAKLSALAAAYAMAFSDEALMVKELEAIDHLAQELGIEDTQKKRVRAAIESQVQSSRSGDWEIGLALENMLDDSNLL